MAVRKLKPFIFVTIVTSCVCIIFSGISLGTKEWYSGKVVNQPTSENASGLITTEIRYGLFKGSKVKTASDNDKFDLTVTCTETVCMYSCGTNSEKRKADLKNLMETGTADDTAFCVNIEESGKSFDRKNIPKVNKDNVEGFLSFGYWLSAVVFIGIGIFFSGLSGALALYNTLEAPIQPIISIFGLYIWNGIAALSILLSMILWGTSFGVDLKKSGAVSETISIGMESNSQLQVEGRLGYSYWILLVPIIVHIVNICLLKYRSWTIAKMDQKITQVIDDKLTSGDNLLF